MRQRVVSVGLSLLLSTGCVRESGPAMTRSDAMALQDVTLMDGTGVAPRSGMTIVIERGSIRDIFATGSKVLPGDVEIVDAGGRFVIPGLIDSHVHLATFEREELHPHLLRNVLLGGVTAVRDMGGNARVVAGLAHRERADPGVESPRIFHSAVVAGPSWFASYDTVRQRYWSDGRPPGTAPGLRRLETREQIAGIVAEAVALGATGIKVFAGVTPGLLAQLTADAHRAGLLVWSHAATPPARPEEVLRAGVNVMSHADMLVWAAAPAGETPGDRNRRSELMRTVRPGGSESVDSLLRAMAERDVLLDPTLLVMIGSHEARPLQPSGRDSVYAWSIAATRRARELGVAVAAGTDDMGTHTPNIHVELQILVDQAGFTPLEAIQAATQHAARVIGAQDSMGTVRVGGVADLVVLSADPALDIRNTQTVVAVIKAGRLFRRTEPWRAPPIAQPPPR